MLVFSGSCQFQTLNAILTYFILNVYYFQDFIQIDFKNLIFSIIYI